jgi:signal transduction histidine kinase
MRDKRQNQAKLSELQKMTIQDHRQQAQLTPEQMVACLKEELAHARKLSALGELAGTTTHEFNNVLTTIINYAKMGLRHKDAATREKAFDKILSAAQRAARITNSILGMARKRNGKFEPTDLALLVEDTLLLLEREMAKYHVAVEKYFHPAPPAMVNANQIQQVLMNLLVNARQAMPNGGRVVIKVAPDPQQETIDVVIRDTGAGIAPENLRRIFEPYFTTKTGPDASGKGGTGLGLALCRDIIEAHQGRIRVESTLGKGTAFTLKLPFAGRVSSQPILPQPAPSQGVARDIPPASRTPPLEPDGLAGPADLTPA